VKAVTGISTGKRRATVFDPDAAGTTKQGLCHVGAARSAAIFVVFRSRAATC